MGRPQRPVRGLSRRNPANIARSGLEPERHPRLYIFATVGYLANSFVFMLFSRLLAPFVQ
jgi:hypothetical protein